MSTEGRGGGLSGVSGGAGLGSPGFIGGGGTADPVERRQSTTFVVGGALTHQRETATNQLRWLTRKEGTLVLQQAFEIDTVTMGEVTNRKVEWRDIPFVEEGA